MGSAALVKTMGVVAVAALAAKAELLPPTAAIATAPRRTRSAASSGSRSFRASAQRYSSATLRPATISLKPWRNAAASPADSSCDLPLRNPTSGSGGCWALVASGHAAVAPDSAIKSRRLISTARCEATPVTADELREG